MREKIYDTLNQIARDNDIEVMFAVESGSRAWGFASKDSDYDVRFVYKRPAHDYLRLDKRTETIEWNRDPILDMVGWDISKFLILLRKSNPSALEWLQCPRYLVHSPYRLRDLEALSEDCFNPRALAFHYAGMARENANEFLRIANGEVRDEPPTTKKYLYVVRAILAAKYVCDYRDMPYIEFSDLVDNYRKQLYRDGVYEAIDGLLKRKREGLEKDVHERLPELDEWVIANLQDCLSMAHSLEIRPAPSWDYVNELFEKIITE